jgi:hypothetical protein
MVTLKILNSLGQEIATLAHDVEEAGSRSTVWNATGFASGVYFYRLEAMSASNSSKRFIQTHKMALVK